MFLPQRDAEHPNIVIIVSFLQVPNLVNNSLPPGDLMIAQHIDDYFRQELIYKRNLRMAERVDELLKTQPDRSFFFAFGAGMYFQNLVFAVNMVQT